MLTENISRAPVSPTSTLARPSRVASSTRHRNPALDFTKGALVLLMVLYHWFNYFTSFQWEQYRYIHFLTPSFIFITGFIVSNIYLAKYDPADFRLPRRLVTRGVKLMAIFIALNAARDLLFAFSPAGRFDLAMVNPKDIVAVFVTGAYSGRLVAFYILIPIAYLLMLSGILMPALRFYRHTFQIVCVLFIGLITTFYLAGIPDNNLELVNIGILGVVAGFRPIHVINGYGRYWVALVVAYLCYLVAITYWNIPYPLLIVGVSLSVLIIYLIGVHGGRATTIHSEIVRLGKYSLFGYISQIVILQVLAAAAHHVRLGYLGLALSFAGAFALTVLSVELVDRARRHIGGIDRIYRAVFA